MERKIILQNTKITYTLRKSRRARRMRLVVYCDGTIVVTTPFGLKETIAEKFIQEKSDWLFSKISFFKQFKGKAIARYSQEDYLKHKDSARKFAMERVDHFNTTYKFKFNRINIKNQKTRWGSCSNKGNLNFNYKIVLLPERLADYIIVHELCHLKELNHSKKFWNLVAKAMPDYPQIKDELNKGGMYLQ